MAHEHSDHHHDHSCRHDAGATLRAAEEACLRKGVRLTPQRRAVLEALAETERPCGAYDLIETLRAKSGRSLAPIAVYRALDFLLENGFIHRLESRNAFIACPHLHASGERVVFLICESCGLVEEAVAAPLTIALQNLAQSRGFSAHRQMIEIAGSCAACQGKPPPDPHTETR